MYLNGIHFIPVLHYIFASHTISLSLEMNANVMENFRITHKTARNKINFFFYISRLHNRPCKQAISAAIATVRIYISMSVSVSGSLGKTQKGKTVRAKNFTNSKINAWNRDKRTHIFTTLHYTYHPQWKVSWCFYAEKQYNIIKVWLTVPKYTHTERENGIERKP